MRLSVLMLLVSVVVATQAFSTYDREVDDGWKNFKGKFHKNFHSEEEEPRKQIYSEKFNAIKAHNNNGSKTYEQTENYFTDMSDEELQSLLGIPDDENRVPREQWSPYGVTTRELPASVDHVADKCMQPVKHQGGCGSCWAFAAINPLEFKRCKVRNNKRVLLSEQQLVDCHPDYKGCDGGWYYSAWEYLKKGSNKHKKYGDYTATQGSCLFNKEFNGAKVKSYAKVPSNPDAIMEAVVNGPVAVAFEVINDFYSYKTGVYSTEGCSSWANHAVVIVGYGELCGEKYWTARNSWGTGWGDKGYFKIKRGVNMCRIEDYVYSVESK